MTEKYRDRAVLAGIGLVQGLFLLALPQLGLPSSWVDYVIYGLVAFALVSGFVFQFLWNGKLNRIQLVFSVVTGLVCSLFIVWQSLNSGPSVYRPEGRLFFSPSVLVSAAFAVYILVAYFGAYQKNNTFKFPYSELFQRSWNNLFIIFTAYGITLLFWGILMLWVSLGKLVDLKVIRHIIFNQSFLSLVLPVIVGFGIAIGKENDKLINVSRRMLLAVFGFLIPFFAIGIVVFFIAGLLQGPVYLLAKREIAFFLPFSIILGILFTNAIFQDASKEPEYPQWVSWLVYTLLLVMPLLAFLNMVKSFSDDSYFYTVGFYQRILAIFLVFYTVAYAISVFLRKKNLLVFLRPVNVIGSSAIVIAIILINSPILDPNRIYAAALYDKIVKGEIKNYSLAAYSLKSRFGKPGLEKSSELLLRNDYPNAALIQQQLRQRGRSSYAVRIPGKDEVFRADNFKVYGVKKPIPDELIVAMKKYLSSYQYNKCSKTKSCVLIAIDLNEDGQIEYLVHSSYYLVSITIMSKINNEWKRSGKLRTKFRSDLMSKTRKALENNKLKIVDPEIKDLMIGEIRYRQ